jgi:aldehyde:ferredoxin oxidoreductase
MDRDISLRDETGIIYGYAGQALRVDLNSSSTIAERLDAATLRKYLGGATLGIKFLYDEVNPSIEWSDPENRLFFGSGPLGGTRIGGSGSIAVVTKGALTNGVASSQANGFFGAFLRFCGFDAIIVQGAAPEWVYLYIHDGLAEIRNANHLVGKNTYEVDHLIKEDLHKKDRQISVLSIGPAGENLVKFACVFADLGHIAGHNGIGAVMGSKKLKAIAVERRKMSIPLKNKEALSNVAGELLNRAHADKFIDMTLADGTVGGVFIGNQAGFLPIKNYTTAVNFMSADKLENYIGQNIRAKFNAKNAPCWACAATHCHMMKITEGKYAGRIFEEPEYEAMAACSSLIGVDDVTTSVLLASEIDRLGLEVNETGWVIAFVMECYERGILSKKDLDGLEMTWGNGEAVMALLSKIAYRQGFGNVLAEGVMRAARQVGGEAPNLAIHTLKGNTPRGHDHRVIWPELFDTCVSNLGTLETHHAAPSKVLGIPEKIDTFDPEMVSTREAQIKGAMIFDDSLVTCRYNTLSQLDLLCDAVNAATGWDMNVDVAMAIGRRAVNLARAFNLRAGIGAELDAPSARYGSTLTDGRAAGKGIMPHWDKMLRNYYTLMGWDANTGKPLPQTLKDLDLDFVIPQLY